MAIDLTLALKKYKTGWVALSKDKKNVVAAGKTIDDVLEKADRQKVKEPVLMSVPQNFDFFIRLLCK